MKLEELLNEAPLPDTWDKEVYNDRTSFAKRIAYAKDRAAKIGTGSSRVAFEVAYEGRPTILKIAKNVKGMHQNEYEAGMLSDYYLKGLQLTIPMIDYDEQSNQPTWIHTEKAGKVTPTMFKKFFGGMTPDDLVAYAKKSLGRKTYRDTSKFQGISENNEHVSDFIDLIGNYDIAEGDLSRLANWGVFNNSLVIIDIGGSSQIINDLYLKRR